jgi:predicted nucleotidyltransferase
MVDFQELRKQIAQACSPDLILLFGSQAKGTATDRSDVDLCVVAATENKRRLLTQLYCQVEAEKPIDFLLYTPEEWEVHVTDPHSFAYKINREGVRLDG